MALQELNQKFPITDPKTGQPSDYFLRYLRDRGGYLTEVEGQVVTLAAEIANRQIIAGTGLDGGGPLSADVTLDLADTTVTPGSYTNTNLTVDAQGRITAASNGSGGSGAWWFQPPLASSFTLVSGDATNLTLSDDSDVGLIIDSGAPVTGDKCRFAYRTLTDKTKDFSLVIRCDVVNIDTNYAYWGIGLQDSVGGRFIGYKFDNNRTLDPTRYTNLGTFSGSGSGFTMSEGEDVKWLRVDRVGANYIFMVSGDGKNWNTIIKSESVTAFLANAADRVGLFVGYNRATGPKLSPTCNYFSLTGPAV